jgi:hypothetical protein
LIELLPRRAGAARPDAARPDPASPRRRQKASSSGIVWLIVVVLGAAVLIGALADGAQRWKRAWRLGRLDQRRPTIGAALGSRARLLDYRPPPDGSETGPRPD